MTIKETFEIIKVQWKLHDKSIRNSFPKYPYKNQLIQIYGDSPKFDKNSLLFIGLYDTLEPIWECLIAPELRIKNISYMFGEVLHGMSMPDPKQSIIASVILQRVLNPPYCYLDKENNHEIATEQPYLIMNSGDRGKLPMDVSNMWLIEKK